MRQMSLPEFVKECGSVSKASYALEVPYPTLLRWLNGTNKPSQPMIRLCKQKGVNLEWSATINAPTPTVKPVVDNPATEI